MERLPDLDPADPRPIHQQIAARVREAIESGVLQPGDRVPGENLLMTRYAVSRWTAREALALLANSGLITKVPKVGTFVRDQRRLQRKPRRYRRQRGTAEFATEARAAGLHPDIEADSRVVEAAEDIAARLEIPAGTEVMRTEYRFLADGRPIQLATSFEPFDLTRDTPIERPEEGPLAGTGVITRMDSIGVEITRVAEEVSTRLPSPGETEALRVPSGVPVFCIHRTFSTDQRPVEIADIVIPGDRYALTYEFRVTEDDDPVTL
ncbi:GntR family transcriptional regulator [Krasilnikovia cinnamomea]|uniref:GntR family transcriptional regulator n=2 Tax=Krasilnikovia cinnamomea TaxID=349313 RepID=A0A4Q7ZKC1_9ACTN|nr:GntR family transcriptional regulator [Krasilnikovia cinnamomea]